MAFFMCPSLSQDRRGGDIPPFLKAVDEYIEAADESKTYTQIADYITSHPNIRVDTEKYCTVIG